MRMSQLLGEPTVIKEPGQYITRKGEIVTVESVKKGWAKGNYSNGVEEYWDVSGRVLPFCISDNDIVSRS